VTAGVHLDELRAMARHRRERLQLYRAKVHSPRPTRPGRLEELTREHELAVSSLERATAGADRPRPTADP
jgi:hypothetical protein